jgi:chitinase
LNDGHGHFQEPLIYSEPSSGYSMLTAQLDSDGRPDVVVGGNGGVSVMRNICLPQSAVPEQPGGVTPAGMPDFENLKRTCDQRALPFSLVDADYSRSLDRIVIAATLPNQLAILDPRSGVSRSVPLTRPPQAVSVAPAGHTAVVLQEGAVSWIDLDSASLIKTLPGYTGGEIVLADNQFAYLSSLQDGSIASIDLAHETSTLTRADPYSGIALNARRGVVYACSPYSGPVNIEQYAISGGHAQYLTTSDTPWELYPPLFASLDGNRTFSSTGTVLFAAPGKSRDLQVETSLQAPFWGFGYRYIASDLVNRRTYAIQGGNTYQGGLLASFVPPEQWIAVYADLDLSYQGVIPVPCRSVDNHEVEAYGRFVFASEVGDRIYVITTTSNEAALPERWGLGVFDALGRLLTSQ